MASFLTCFDLSTRFPPKHFKHKVSKIRCKNPKQVASPEFRDYCERVVRNCRALGSHLSDHGSKLVTWYIRW